MSRIFAYCRISTVKQSIERQIANVKREYPNATIITESYTGTTTDRPAWNKLRKCLKKGDVVVFDEISRMSRNAAEGFELYKTLFAEGITLVFLKEPHLNTDVYRQALQSNISMTGTDVDIILKSINEYLMVLASKQIQIAFETAQHEVDFLHQRTSEGVRRAQAEGKQVGRASGTKVETKKSKEMKKRIYELSKDFDGKNSDVEVIKILGIARGTYYKYKSEIKATL